MVTHEKVSGIFLYFCILMMDASVLTAAAIARVSAYFGQGSGPIQIDGVQCSGTESELRNCSYSQTNKCGHSADVGVTCNG